MVIVSLAVFDHVFEQIRIGSDAGMFHIRRTVESEHHHPAGNGLLDGTDEALDGHAHAAHSKRWSVQRVVHGGSIDAAMAAASESISPAAQERIELRINNIERPGERCRSGNAVGDRQIFKGPDIGLETRFIRMRQ